MQAKAYFIADLLILIKQWNIPNSPSFAIIDSLLCSCVNRLQTNFIATSYMLRSSELSQSEIIFLMLNRATS